MERELIEGALKGIKVADFSWAIVGPFITKCLADFGATVVRVESQKRPDDLRTAGPFKDWTLDFDHSGYFALFNSNKYGMSLDLNHPRAVEVAKRLIAWADIVIESFRPGIMDKWGLGYKDLTKVKPDIIMLSTSIYGQSGPYAGQPGVGNLLVGLSGFTEITGWADRGPVQPYGAYTDAVAPNFGVAALMAAIDYRQRTGKGQYLDLSQLECSMHFLSVALLDYVANNRLPTRQGNSCDYAVPHSVYRCKGKDRWCAIAVFTDTQWECLCKVIDNPTLLVGKFSTFLNREKNEDELNRLVEEWTISRTPEQVMSELQAAGVPAGVVQNAADLLRDPHLNARQYFWWMKHTVLGSFPHFGQSSHLSNTPAQQRMPAPCLGGHTEFVCREILGLSDEEFVELLQEGVFE